MEDILSKNIRENPRRKTGLRSCGTILCRISISFCGSNTINKESFLSLIYISLHIYRARRVFGISISPRIRWLSEVFSSLAEKFVITGYNETKIGMR